MKNPYRDSIEVCIRAVIRNRGRILVCWNKKKGYYFFPGGHLEFGESFDEALAREIKEELGGKIKNSSFIGLVDNLFREDGEQHHEINLVFLVEVGKTDYSSREDHIEFAFFDKKGLAGSLVYPVALKKAVLKWLSDGKVFWVSQS